MASETVFIESMERARYLVTAIPAPTIVAERCSLYSFYDPAAGLLTVSARCGTLFTGQCTYEAGSHDDAVRRSRREIAAYYRDLPGHSLVEQANAELARCIIIATEPQAMLPALSPPGEPCAPAASYPPDTEPRITRAEAAELLGVSLSVVTGWLADHPHVSRRHGRCHLIAHAAVMRAKEQAAQRPHLPKRQALRLVD